MENTQNPLIGKTLVSVHLSDNDQGILFETENGEEHVAWTDADCCSHTWIEHVSLCHLPSIVLSIEDVDMPDGHYDDGDLIQFYGFRITTTNGYIDVEYRNSSNGYYGGSISWLNTPEGKDNHYGGVHDQNAIEETPIWRLLIEDV